MAEASIDLKSLREDQLKMSQKAFAEWFGVDQSTVSNWEKKGIPTRGLVRESFDRRLPARSIGKRR